MSGVSRHHGDLKLFILVGLLAVTQVAVAQNHTMLLRMQRARATLNIEDVRIGVGRNINDIALTNDPQDVWSYPNSASCLVVYNDGKYVLEKRDEQTVGKPKIKSAEGDLGADDLQQLQAILDNDELKKIMNPKALELPPGTQALREAESLDVQIVRAGITQHFTTLKERVKTAALGSSSISTAPSTGLDTFLDNGTPYKKTLSPLMKWFEGLEKKSKSTLKNSKSLYCMPMNIG